MKKRSAVLVVILALGLTIFSCEKPKQQQQAPPPPEVGVYITKAEEVAIYKTFIGQAYGAKDISIRARVEGFLKEIHFKEGSDVRAGDLLYVIDSQPFEADVASRKGKLAEANTMMVRARRDLERYRPLAESRAISQSDLDGAEAEYQASQAAVEAAQANVRAAQIQLGYTKIYSPIDGIIGKTQAKVGDFVGREPNPVILNTVSNTNSVHVEFFLTETQYLGIARHILELEREGKDLASQKKNYDPDLRLILADGQPYEHKGIPNFMDREIDPATGAILVQVSFPNPDGLIRPGQFAKVRVKADEEPEGILIPQRCVSELQGIQRVFVVKDDDMIEERQVDLGPTVDNFWLVNKGLKPGERIVYEGLQKVSDGAKVRAKDVEVDRIKQDVY